VESGEGGSSVISKAEALVKTDGVQDTAGGARDIAEDEFMAGTAEPAVQYQMEGEVSISTAEKSTMTSKSHLSLVISLMFLSSSRVCGSGGKTTSTTSGDNFSILISGPPSNKGQKRRRYKEFYRNSV
jgi:hypothetical protein